MSEYIKFIGEYPNIDFVGNKPSKENSLFQLECANISPQNYLLEHILKYKKVYTWNDRLYEEYKLKNMNVVKIPNFPLFDNYYELDTFIPFKEKIDGICLICRYRQKQKYNFDISYKRIEVFESLENIEKHCYGKIPYCGENYRGVIGKGKGTYPSSKEKLEVLNKYKFNLCFENAYHEMWTIGYVTEKITDCFKAKTIPVYWGAYDIENKIPKELYIDYREYQRKDELVKRLKSIDKNEYEDMTEKAFEWEKENKLGSIEELKNLLWYAENDVCIHFDGGVCCHETKNAGEVSESYCNECEYKRTL